MDGYMRWLKGAFPFLFFSVAFRLAFPASSPFVVFSHPFRLSPLPSAVLVDSQTPDH